MSSHKTRQKTAAYPPGQAPYWRVAEICLVLATITFAVFGQTAGFQFVNYDDRLYVYGNPFVQGGLTLKGAIWALTYGDIGHWHPLTWLTHMADWQIYGLRAGGHHLTNVALHTMAVMLLFLALREMTGNLWRSAFVAAVFAIHPLRAESVAWIAERKDVLSGLFFMLTLWAYARYVRRPSRWRYALVTLAFALGLLSKNMLVTLPFVLLLLDFWPFKRMPLDGADRGGTGAGKLAPSFRGLLKEKIPLFLLSAGSCVATALVPEKVSDYAREPFLASVGNAVLSYVVYLRQMVYPADLAAPYLYPRNGLSLWKVALAFVLLTAISMVVLAWRRRRPYLAVGWLWYLGMLVPVIGLVQISNYSHADRYTYLPGIGLLMAVTWAVGDWSMGWKHREAVLAGLMAAVLGSLMVCARQQTAYWKNGETFWRHTLACTTDNYIAHANLGDYLLEKKTWGEAIAQYQIASKIHLLNAESHNNFGVALCADGRVDEGIGQYEEALRIKPAFAEAHFNLGKALRQQGKVAEAIARFQKAIQLQPGLVAARSSLGNILLEHGKEDQAVPQFQKILELDPTDASAHLNLGLCFFNLGRMDEAIMQYQKALQLEPSDPGIENNLALLLATCPQASLRDGDRAVELARHANTLTGGQDPVILHTLAAAFAQAGHYSEAVENAQRALKIAEVQSNARMAGTLQSELKLYQAGKPFTNQ